MKKICTGYGALILGILMMFVVGVCMLIGDTMRLLIQILVTLRETFRQIFRWGKPNAKP